MASSAPLPGPDLELQLGAPFLEPRGRNNSWRIWPHLPRRDTSLAVFLVKSSEGLATGILTLNVFNATHLLAAVPKENETRLNLCFSSSANQKLKVFILAIPFILFPVTLWISGMAKMVESDHRGLSVVSVVVILEFIWAILASALLTHCITEASYIWVIAVMAIVIVLLLIVWTITFNRPKCFRMFFCSFCCCGMAPEIAAAEANDQSIAAAELARQVAIAQEAFAAQVGFQTEAFAATERALEADRAKNTAKEEAAIAFQNFELACKTMVAAEAEVDRIKKEMEALATAASDPVTEETAHESISEVEQNTSTHADEEANRAIKKLDDATRDYGTSEETYRTAKQNAVGTAASALTKKEEVIQATQKVTQATAAAEAAYKKAAAARSIAAL